MGLFSRRGAGRGRPDEALPFLGVEQADEVRSLVGQTFAELGIEVTVRQDHVVDSSARVFGLWNVATACHHDERGRAGWPDVVRDHVQRILREMDDDPFEQLTPEDVAARTYLRLWDEASVPDLDRYPHREFAPGIVELLALDLPDSVAISRHQRLRRCRGHGYLRLPRVWRCARSGQPARLLVGRQGYHQLTQRDGDGQVSIVVPPAFQKALDEIAREG